MDPQVESHLAQEPTLRRAAVEVIVAVIAGVILKAVGPLISRNSGLSPWIVELSIWSLVSIILARAAWVWTAPRVRRTYREWKIERKIREPFIGTAKLFVGAMNESFARGAGNVLHDLTSAKTIDARYHNECSNHFATLADIARWVIEDVRAKRVPARVALDRLINAHLHYVRLCGQLVGAVSLSDTEHVHLKWDEIREHANSIGNRLAELYQQVRMLEGNEVTEIYVGSVARSTRRQIGSPPQTHG